MGGTRSIKLLFFSEEHLIHIQRSFHKKIGVNFGSSYFVEAFCRAKKPGSTPFDLSLESESSNPKGVRVVASVYFWPDTKAEIRSEN